MTLDDALALVRAGNVDAATAALGDLSEHERLRASLAIAYRAGNTARAVEIANALWLFQRRDPTVAAVLTLHGTGAMKAAASAALGAAIDSIEIDLEAAAADLAADPTSLPRWRQMLRGLVYAGRMRDAVEGVGLALQEGQAGRELWAMLGTELLVAGSDGTSPVAEIGVRWFPSDPEVHALAALLRLASGELESAAELASRAVRLNPACGFAYVAEAAVLAAAGREHDARHSLDRGVALGIDAGFGMLEEP